jgi:PAS domain S-box-containing protein
MLREQTRGLKYTVAWFSVAAGALLTGVCLAVARLIADREASQQALRHSEERFRQMAESMDEAFWLTSADHQQLLYVSPAFEKIWGHSCTSLETARRAWLDSIHPDDRSASQAALMARNGDPFSIEYRIVRPYGDVRWIWDRGFAVRDDAGQIVRYAGIAEDVSVLKETQRNLLQSERLAAIGEAITGLAHESRNALQRSQACLEMLLKRVAAQPEAADLARRTQAALRDLHRLYERVRVYAAPIQLERRRCDLRQVWRRACDDLQEIIQQRNAVIVEAPCPTGLDARCLVDELALRRAYCNIIENALSEELDATARRDRVTIEVCWEQAVLEGAPAVKCVVRDNGPGSTQCQRIFDPFFTTKAKGTGLGMAICRGIIEAHGGQVTASSPEGGGLSITILLRKGVP